MPSRRWFVSGVASVAAAVPTRAVGGGCPRPTAPGPDARSGCLDIAAAYRETDGGRRDPAAAWLACIAIVFASYGHPVAQSRIAQDAYGGLAAVPVREGYAALARPLDRMWTDDGGAMFRVACEPLYDAGVAAARFDPAPLVPILAAGDPIVVWAGERPVVLTALQLVRLSAGWTVRSGAVFDPAPGAGVRAPSDAEKTLAWAGAPPAFAMRVSFPGLG